MAMYDPCGYLMRKRKTLTIYKKSMKQTANGRWMTMSVKKIKGIKSGRGGLKNRGTRRCRVATSGQALDPRHDVALFRGAPIFSLIYANEADWR